jgi:hypothetical protein
MERHGEFVESSGMGLALHVFDLGDENKILIGREHFFHCLHHVKTCGAVVSLVNDLNMYRTHFLHPGDGRDRGPTGGPILNMRNAYESTRVLNPAPAFLRFSSILSNSKPFSRRERMRFFISSEGARLAISSINSSY